MAIGRKQDSHTLELIESALMSAERLCASRHSEELKRPSGLSGVHQLTHALNRLAERVGLHVARTSYMRAVEGFRYDSFEKWVSAGTLRSALEDPDAFDRVYDALADEASRRVYDWYISCRSAYAIVGQAAFGLYPPPQPRLEYERQCQVLARRTRAGYRVGDWTIECEATTLVDSLLLDQYGLKGIVEPQSGDVALDIGAYKGETSLWLAEKLGATGEVVAFEPNPQTRVILQSNVDRNMSATMAPVRIVPYGVAASGGRRSFVGTAGSSSLLDDAGETVVDVTTIDDVVRSGQLDRVDFVKMDIEGGELDALRGARETLKTLAPRLAICVYHRPRDLPDIVDVIGRSRPDYRFYLSHKSPSIAETVLFACVSR